MKYGFIGVGNMSGAIIRGMLKNGFSGGDILVYNRTAKKAEEFSAKTGTTVCESIESLCRAADVIILATTPQSFDEVLPHVKRGTTPDKLVISIAAGRDTAALKEALGQDVPIVRVMPNVNSKVCASTSGYMASDDVSAEQTETVEKLFGAIGSITELKPEEFNPFKALAGCGVAFAYMYIDAMARAALKHGMPKEKAIAIAADALMGSAKLVLESGEHPFALIDQVTTPGGTTIEGIVSLQADGFESALHRAVDAVIAKDAVISAK